MSAHEPASYISRWALLKWADGLRPSFVDTPEDREKWGKIHTSVVETIKALDDEGIDDWVKAIAARGVDTP